MDKLQSQLSKAVGELEDYELLLLIREEVARRVKEERFGYIDAHDSHAPTAEMFLIGINLVMKDYL